MDFRDLLTSAIRQEVQEHGGSAILDGIERWLAAERDCKETSDLSDDELVEVFLEEAMEDVVEKLIWIIQHEGAWPKSLDRDDWWTCDIPPEFVKEEKKAPTMKDLVNFLRSSGREVRLYGNSNVYTLDEWEKFLERVGVIDSPMAGCEVHFSIKEIK